MRLIDIEQVGGLRTSLDAKADVTYVDSLRGNLPADVPVYTNGGVVPDDKLGRMVRVAPTTNSGQVTLPKPRLGGRLTVVNTSSSLSTTLLAPRPIVDQYGSTSLTTTVAPAGTVTLVGSDSAWFAIASSDAARLNGHVAADFLLTTGGALTGALTGTTVTLSGGVTAPTFTGSLAGNAATATSASTAASALTAVKLAAPRAINGVNFDGSSGVTLDATALGFRANVAAVGYEVLPTGRIVQWGTAVSSGTSSSGNIAITLPVAFADDCYSATANVIGNAGYYAVLLTSSTATKLTLTALRNGARASGVQVCWQAIGR